MRGAYVTTTTVDISFIHSGIRIEYLWNNISAFEFPVTFYGIIIGLDALAGIQVAQSDTKRRGQNPEDYLDFVLYAAIFSIIEARLYYVAFAWDNYRDDLLQILSLRVDGLAIHGGVVVAVVTLTVYTRVGKLSFPTMADSDRLGLVTGQIIGRWGNLFSCETFGGYTGSPLVMRLKRSLVNESMISSNLINHLVMESGIEYI